MARLIQVEQVARPVEQVSFTSFRRISFEGCQEVVAPPEPVFVEPRPTLHIIPVKSRFSPITRKNRNLSPSARLLLNKLIATTSLY